MNELNYLDLHGERIAYYDVGRGPVVLLIHGMASSSATWRTLLPQLSKRYRVIAPDLLGHGQSAKPRGDYSLGAFAVWLRDLLDELDVARVTLVGQSLGGGVAMQFVHQHPEYCERIVLIGSGGLGPEVGLALRLLAVPGSELLLPAIAPSAVVAAGDRVRSWLAPLGLLSAPAAETWSAYSSLSKRPAREAFLRTLRSVVDHRGQAVSAFNRLHFSSGLPALLIWGDDDRIIPVAHAHAAHAAIPGSRLVVLPGIGHYPHLEACDAVFATFNDFFNTTAPWRRETRAEVCAAVDYLRC